MVQMAVQVAVQHILLYLIINCSSHLRLIIMVTGWSQEVDENCEGLVIIIKRINRVRIKKSLKSHTLFKTECNKHVVKVT